MREFCAPADYEKIGAIYTLNRLFIWAIGKTPHPQIKVRIERSPLRRLPQMYDLVACSNEFITGVFQPTNYAKGVFFETAQPRENFVPVNTAQGLIEVPLFVPAPIPFDPTRLMSDREGGAMPSPFAANSILSKLPVNLSRVFETGNREDVEIPQEIEKLKRVEPTGYSSAFSFDEAFQDALNRLPVDDSGAADKLINVSVDSIGAEFGGIAGISRMRVTVSVIH